MADYINPHVALSSLFGANALAILYLFFKKETTDGKKKAP